MDVPPALSARVRLLDAGRKDKNDAHDARSTAIVALRHQSLRVVGVEDHRQVLRLLARRHHQLVVGRTRAICRVHALLAETIEGGATRNLSVNTAVSALRRFRPTDTIGRERKRLATELLDEVRRHDRALVELHHRTVAAVTAANTTVTDVFGVGPIVACYLIGYSGDVRRFPTAGHYARYNATAPIEASSGPKVRHRLNPNGNRQLNHAIHIAALGQISHDTPGRAYYLAQTDRREVAQRSDALLETTRQRHHLPPTPRRPQPLNRAGLGRTIRGDSESSAAGRSLNADTSERSLPNPTTTLRLPTRHVTGQPNAPTTRSNKPP